MGGCALVELYVGAYSISRQHTRVLGMELQIDTLSFYFIYLYFSFFASGFYVTAASFSSANSCIQPNSRATQQSGFVR